LPKPIKTQNDKYVFVTFEEIPISSFFYSNNNLCVKIDVRKYLRIIPVLDKTEIIEWDKSDFKGAYIVDIHYKYKLRK